MNTKKCPNCNAENSMTAQFCRTCGSHTWPMQSAPVAQSVVLCPTCRAPLKDNANFCCRCGAKVNGFNNMVNYIYTPTRPNYFFDTSKYRIKKNFIPLIIFLFCAIVISILTVSMFPYRFTRTDYGTYAVSGYSEKSTKYLVIPSTYNGVDVTEIEEGVFKDRSKLVEVVLPSSINVIGENAFSGCTNLKKIEFPLKLQKIGEFAFAGCVNLTEVKLPQNIGEIGESTFENCTSLTVLDLPDLLRVLGANSFSGCSNLSEVDLPNALYSIGTNAFKGTVIKEIIIPNSMHYISDYAFANIQTLEKVYIYGNTMYIGQPFIGSPNVAIFVSTQQPLHQWDHEWSSGSSNIFWNQGLSDYDAYPI